MPDEVSLGELARRMDELKVMLRDLVSRGEYATDQRHIERRFGELERDLEVERQARQAADKEIKEQVTSATSTSGTNIRQAIYSGLIPGVLFLISVLITMRGGK